LTWVNWFNNRRLLEPIGNIPPWQPDSNQTPPANPGGSIVSLSVVIIASSTRIFHVLIATGCRAKAVAPVDGSPPLSRELHRLSTEHSVEASSAKLFKGRSNKRHRGRSYCRWTVRDECGGRCAVL
jgi:hypothetical protein